MAHARWVLNTYRRTWYGTFISIYSAVLCLLDLAWLAAFGRSADQVIPAALLAVFLGAVALRARGTCVIVQSEDDVRVREVHWTRRIRRENVTRFTVETGPIRPRQLTGSFLVAELKDGSLRSFKEFSARSNDSEGQMEIERVAGALNAAWHLG